MRYQKRQHTSHKREQYNRLLLASKFKTQRNRPITTPRPLKCYYYFAKKFIYGGRSHEE